MMTGGPPKKKAKMEDVNVPMVQASHILAKHARSRRPSSWREEKITCTKEQAVARLTSLRDTLHETVATGGSDTQLAAKFAELAKTDSDCNSAAKGGELGKFGRGKMQKAFEEAAFSLAPGTLSGIVDTDSGVHLVLVTNTFL